MYTHQKLQTCYAGAVYDGQGEESFEQVAGSVCLEVYREALRGVVTASRRYKDELLEACLELLLSAPASVMTIHVSSLHMVAHVARLVCWLKHAKSFFLL